MNSIFQIILSKPIKFKGIGLHKGEISNVKLVPAMPNTGIVFKRIDCEAEKAVIEANYKNVTSANLCTTLTNKYGVSVSTVEHLLAAFYILGVDNVTVEIDKEEVPILDGSSKRFIEIIKKTGLQVQNKKRKFIKILKEVNHSDEKKEISISPNNFGLSVEFKLRYENKIIGNQTNKVNFYKDDLEDVYSSRTFCLYEDIEKIKKAGLAKGGSLENAIVVSDKKVLNLDGLRNNKEFVNHKILDLSGDMFLAGLRVMGSVICKEGGHNLTVNFLKKILADENNYVEIDLENIEPINKKLKIKQNLSATA